MNLFFGEGHGETIVHIMADEGWDKVRDSLDVIGGWVLGGKNGGVVVDDDVFNILLIRSEDAIVIFQNVDAIYPSTFSGGLVEIGCIAVSNC